MKAETQSVTTVRGDRVLVSDTHRRDAMKAGADAGGVKINRRAAFNFCGHVGVGQKLRTGRLSHAQIRQIEQARGRSACALLDGAAIV